MTWKLVITYYCLDTPRSLLRHEVDVEVGVARKQSKQNFMQALKIKKVLLYKIEDVALSSIRFLEYTKKLIYNITS